jgi:transposase
MRINDLQRLVSNSGLDKLRYRRRNEVERLFRRLKAWRRVFTRYDKLDVMFAAFITMALMAETLRLR